MPMHPLSHSYMADKMDLIAPILLCFLRVIGYWPNHVVREVAAVAG